jgi:hypothetical protein
MPWHHISISRFGGPEVLELAEQPVIPEPGTGETRIKVLAAGTGFTDAFIRRGRYPDFKGPLPFTPGYDLVGIVEKLGRGVTEPPEGQLVADLCVTGGYAQYAIRPARLLVPVPDGVEPANAVCIPLAYLTAYQMLTLYDSLPKGATILVIGASGTVGTALLDLARHLGLKAIGTCSAANLAAGPTFRRSCDRLPRRRFRCRRAQDRRRAAGRPRRRCCLRRDWWRAFQPLFRLPRVRRPAGRLWVANHGGRRRELAFSGVRLSSAETLGDPEVSVRWP